MTRKLQVNVQFDRLPKIAGDTADYFGVRLSAWIASDGVDRAVTADKTRLLPWQWTGADATQPGSWAPTAASSWKAWWIDLHPVGTPPVHAVTPAIVTPIGNPAAHALPPEWLGQLTATVDDLASVPVRLEGSPASGPNGRPAPVTGQTLFGFVESLSPLPSPWPEAHKVWTCLRIDTPAPTNTCELVVAPLFGVNVPGGVSGVYSLAAAPNNFTGTLSDHVWQITYTGAPAGLLSATAVVDRLVEDNEIGARILLKDRFLIKKGWAEVSNQDWMIQLPMQIGEILDAGPVFIKALDELLPKIDQLWDAATKTPIPNRTPRQIDLLATRAPYIDRLAPQTPQCERQRAALRLLLGALHWRVLAPCATGTQAVTPLPVAFARANISTDSQNLLAGLTARDATRTTLDATLSGFMTSEPLQVWKDGHLDTLLGLPADNLGLAWGPSVDVLEELRTFLIGHWADPLPSPPPATPTWPSRALTLTTTPVALMQMITTELKWNGATWSIERDWDRSVGLFDLSALSAPGSASLSFTMSVSQANAVITATLWLDGIAAPVATAVSPQITPGDQYTLTLTVTSTAAGPASFAASVDTHAGVPAPIGDADFFNHRAYIKLQLAAAGPKVEVKAAKTLSLDAVDNLLRSPDAELRASAAIGLIAPFIPFILRGIGPNGSSVTPTSPPGAPPAPPHPPAETLKLALLAWAQDRFHAECEAAIKLVEDQLAPPLPALPAAVIAPLTRADIVAAEPLFRFIAKYSSVAVANVQIQKLIDSFRPQLDYAVSVKALPVAFPIDQPQPIEGSQDIWSMFAGVGVLAGLSLDPAAAWPDNNIWYSLNLANMYVSQTRPTDSLPTKVLVAGPKGGFDPVPLQVGEVGGVRAAMITYENRSLVAQMPHEWDHTSSTPQRSMPRRIESYKFPTAQKTGGNPKLPALSFGKGVFFLPYLLGHGGALPVCLRAHPTSPTTFRPKTVTGDPVHDNNGNLLLGKDHKPISDPGGGIVFAPADLTKDLVGLTNDAGHPLAPSDVVRSIAYQRTTPVAAPRIYSASPLPGIPDGVEPLASELPIIPAAITIASHETVYFYSNKEKTEGVLDFTAAEAADNFIQVVLSAPPSDPNVAPVAWPDLAVGFAGRGKPSLLPSVTIAAKEASCPGLRLTVKAQGISLAKQLSRRPDDPFVERPPQYGGESLSAQTIDFKDWQAFFISITNSSATDVTLLPPKVVLGSIENDPRQGTPTPVTTLREIPLSGVLQQKRVITVLDGIAPVLPHLNSVTLKVRRPAVEFSTFERWINWDLSDPEVKESLDKAYELAAQTNPTRNDDLAINDPAVERLVVELIELFPSPQSYGPLRLLDHDWSSKASILSSFKTSRNDDPSVVVRVAQNGPAGIAPNGNGSAREIVLAPGGVYEVRFYGAVPEDKQQLADASPPAAQRFGKGVWQGLRKFVAPGGVKYRLGPPLSLTFEVSTDLMPTLTRKQSDADQDMPLQVDRMVAQSGDKARVMLRQSFVLNNYPVARYVNRVSLLSQRWGWRGRSVGTLPPIEEFPAKPVATARPPAPAHDRSRRLPPGDIKDFESIAFVDRRDDDIGMIEDVKLHLSNLMPALDVSGALKHGDDDGRPPLLNKDLLYKGGANWWRFALSATSRYAAMKPGRSSLIRYSHINPQHPTAADWHTLIVRDRDNGRMPKRPGLILVLPLTETMMSDTAIPPVLAIFSEPMFPGFHIGDGIDIALDYARYPLLDGPQRFWPEFGPDPILTGAAHSGKPVPIRTDGPIGYTFDMGAEAPHFGRSGYLVTPISGMDNSAIRPWSLARLRFRRLEAIELSLFPAYPVGSGGVATQLLLTSAGVTLDPSIKATPHEYHEGLVIDFAQLTSQTNSQTISTMPGPHPPVPPAAPVGLPPATLTVQATAGSENLTIDMTSNLGSAGTYRLAMRPSSRAWLRVVLSQRDKPQDGGQPYQPVVDVAVRLLVDDGEDGLVRSQTGSWMTIACVPLLADGKTFMPTDPVFIKVEPTVDPAEPLLAYGARLTSFTPPVWCQFTQDVSRFDLATVTDASFKNYPVAEIVVTLTKDKKPTLSVKSDTANPQVVQSIKWLRPDDGSQVASVVAAVVTEYIVDVSDRVRERPVAVYRLDDGSAQSGQTPGTAVTPKLLWPTDPAERAKIASAAPARVRLMSMMHLQLDPSASASPPTSLADYFNEPFEDTISMTASDAIGRILGVSKPIEISK